MYQYRAESKVSGAGRELTWDGRPWTEDRVIGAIASLDSPDLRRLEGALGATGNVWWLLTRKAGLRVFPESGFHTRRAVVRPSVRSETQIEKIQVRHTRRPEAF
jgi:hypothetical protein